MPEEIQLKFIEIVSAKKMNCSHGAGRPYWAQSATELGLVHTEEGIRFMRDVPPGTMIMEQIPNYFCCWLKMWRMNVCLGAGDGR
jgi:hypothetical protein